MLELALGGLSTGALYALTGLGLSITFGLMRQINLAHGDLIILAAFVTHVLAGYFGLPILAAIPIASLAMFIIGYLLQIMLLDSVIGRGVLSPLLVTFGLSIVLQNSMQLVFKADTRSLDPGMLGSSAVSVAGISIGVMPVTFIGVAISIFAVMALLLGKTVFGVALRATADDNRTAQLMGISPKRIFAVASGLSVLASTVAAICLGMRSTFSPSSGPEQLIFAFETVVLGGLGSVWGTLAGGFILGLAQVAGASFAPIYGPLAGHILFLVVLLVRPQGLFSNRQVQ